MPWPTKKLGEVVTDLEKERLFNLNPSFFYIEPTISSKEHKILPKRKARGSEFKVKRRIIIKPNDLVIAKLHTQNGLFAYADQEYASTTNFIPLRVNENLIDRRFLFYALSVFIKALGSVDTVGRETYSKEQILRLKIPVPPLEIQRKIVERLDAIKKAQGLNDKQIELAEELFQSLLNKELEPRDKSWKIKRVKQVLSSEKFTVGKLKRSQYQKAGQLPIIDQGDNEIAGYSDNENLAYKDELPIVIYGDHTRIVKYADFPFIIGADGVKVLLPKKEIMIPKYLYYALQYFNVESRGYRRHFPILKERKIPIPPLATQQRVVKKLSAIQDYKKKLLEQKQKLQELFESVLNKSMKGGLIE